MKLWINSLSLLFIFFVSGAALGQDVWPDISKPPAMTGGGEKDAAVIVGIEDYLIVSDVPGATQNANDWYLWMRKTKNIPINNIFLLKDQEGTKEDIKDAVSKALQKVEPGGTLWFIFIGHGAPAQDGKDGILVGSDVRQTAKSLYSRSLPQQELISIINEGNQEKTILIFDACFSGRSEEKPLVNGLQPMLPVISPNIKQEKIIIMTAGGTDQFAGPLPGQNRPAFSYLLLGALRGWGDNNKDNQITSQEAWSYTKDALGVILTDRTQTPEIFGDQELTLGLSVAEQGPDLDAIRLGKPKTEQIQAKVEPKTEPKIDSPINTPSTKELNKEIDDGSEDEEEDVEVKVETTNSPKEKITPPFVDTEADLKLDDEGGDLDEEDEGKDGVANVDMSADVLSETDKASAISQESPGGLDLAGKIFIWSGGFSTLLGGGLFLGALDWSKDVNSYENPSNERIEKVNELFSASFITMGTGVGFILFGSILYGLSPNETTEPLVHFWATPHLIGVSGGF